jgi:hypothetical protein
MISNKFTLHSISSGVYRYSCFIQTPSVQLIHKIPKYTWYVPNREGLFSAQKYKFLKMKELMKYKIRHSFRNESI